MSEAFTIIRGGTADLLIICDHASAYVPADIDLGIASALLDQHIAVDIGVAEVAPLIVEQLGCTAILGGVSPFPATAAPTPPNGSCVFIIPIIARSPNCSTA